MSQKKLSLVFVTNNYTPYQGGVVSSIQATVQTLQELGHTVTIITLDFVRNLPHEPHVIRINCPIRFMYKKNHMAIPWCPKLILDKLFSTLKPDIIHIHHPFLLGLAALHSAKKRKIPAVFTYHTMYEQYLHYIPLPHKITNQFLAKRLQSFCTAVDGIIAPGTAVKQHLEKIAPATPLLILPSAINSLFFQAQDSQKTHSSPMIRLITVSRFTPEKNLYFLLDVATLLEIPFSFTLAGYGSEYELLQKYAYSVKKLTQIQVTFEERPSKERLIELYHNADIFLFASQTETQGIVLAEAMAQKTPVIALDGPGQRDIIEHGLNGFLVKNQAEMKEKVHFLAKNPFSLTVMKKKACKTAQSYHGSVIIEKLIHFYQQFI